MQSQRVSELEGELSAAKDGSKANSLAHKAMESKLRLQVRYQPYSTAIAKDPWRLRSEVVFFMISSVCVCVYCIVHNGVTRPCHPTWIVSNLRMTSDCHCHDSL